MKTLSIASPLLLLPLLSLAPALTPSPATEVRDELEEEVDRLAQGLADAGVERLSLAVSIGGDSAFSKSWGEEDDAGDVYRVGMLNEQLIAVLALQLAQEEELDLDASIRSILGDLPYEEEGLSVGTLLSHSSGLPDYTVGLPGKELPSPESLMKWLAAMPLEFEPGSCFGFSDTNGLVLGWVIEKVAESPIEKLVAERIFAPLELESTGYSTSPSEVSSQDRAAIAMAGQWIERPATNRPFSATGVYTSAADLIRLQEGLADGELLDGGLEQLSKSPTLGDGSRSSLHCGMSPLRMGDIGGLSYGGALAGSGFYVSHFPEAEMTLAVLAGDDEADLTLFASQVARIFLSAPAPEFKDIKLEPEEQAPYLGGYYIGCNRYLVVSDGKHIQVEPPIGPKHSLLYQGDHRFVSSHDPEVRFTFLMDEESGRSSAFRMDEHGLESTAIRLD